MGEVITLSRPAPTPAPSERDRHARVIGSLCALQAALMLTRDLIAGLGRELSDHEMQAYELHTLHHELAENYEGRLQELLREYGQALVGLPPDGAA